MDETPGSNKSGQQWRISWPPSHLTLPALSPPSHLPLPALSPPSHLPLPALSPRSPRPLTTLSPTSPRPLTTLSPHSPRPRRPLSSIAACPRPSLPPPAGSDAPAPPPATRMTPCLGPETLLLAGSRVASSALVRVALPGRDSACPNAPPRRPPKLRVPARLHCPARPSRRPDTPRSRSLAPPAGPEKPAGPAEPVRRFPDRYQRRTAQERPFGPDPSNGRATRMHRLGRGPTLSRARAGAAAPRSRRRRSAPAEGP